MTFATLKPDRRAAGGGHTGLAKAVYDEIAAHQPLTRNVISQRLDMPTEKVRTALNQLCERSGGIGPVPSSPVNARKYATAEWLRENRTGKVSKKSGVYPVPVRERPFTELRREFWAHADLAWLTRRA